MVLFPIFFRCREEMGFPKFRSCCVYHVVFQASTFLFAGELLTFMFALHRNYDRIYVELAKLPATCAC